MSQHSEYSNEQYEIQEQEIRAFKKERQYEREPTEHELQVKHRRTFEKSYHPYTSLRPKGLNPGTPEIAQELINDYGEAAISTSHLFVC